MTLEELRQIVVANAQAIQGLSANLSAEREQRRLDFEEVRDEISDVRSSITTLVGSHEALTAELRTLTASLNRQFNGNGQQSDLFKNLDIF